MTAMSQSFLFEDVNWSRGNMKLLPGDAAQHQGPQLFSCLTRTSEEMDRTLRIVQYIIGKTQDFLILRTKILKNKQFLKVI